MKPSHPKSRPPPMPTEVAQKLVEKIVQACRDYEDGTIGIRQLYHRTRGYRRFEAVQVVKTTDDALSRKLLFLLLDTQTWFGEHNELIAESALRIARHIKDRPLEFIEE